MRYLKNTETGQVVQVVHEESHVANGHALADPDDPTADPADGWVESDADGFAAAAAAGEKQAAKILERNQAALESAGQKLAKLGLTHAERQALGLP